jgi:hypothetical protein
MPVDNGAGEQEVESGRGAAVVSSTWAVPMVRCNAMDETEGLLEVLVTRSDDFVAGTAVTTEEEATPRMPLTGTLAKRRYMERKWWEESAVAMPRLPKSKSRSAARAVERAAKRHCKGDGRPTEAMLATAHDGGAHAFEPQSAGSDR